MCSATFSRSCSRPSLTVAWLSVHPSALGIFLINSSIFFLLTASPGFCNSCNSPAVLARTAHGSSFLSLGAFLRSTSRPCCAALPYILSPHCFDSIAFPSSTTPNIALTCFFRNIPSSRQAFAYLVENFVPGSSLLNHFFSCFSTSFKLFLYAPTILPYDSAVKLPGGSLNPFISPEPAPTIRGGSKLSFLYSPVALATPLVTLRRLGRRSLASDLLKVRTAVNAFSSCFWATISPKLSLMSSFACLNAQSKIWFWMDPGRPVKPSATCW
mmetsp:Transcript_124629/g.363947  ORF Transcript_124629/g.363947 Transcript_124629/m.363947 type:complete len:270 (-) Transcript_124629:442-1251(-)